MQEVAKELNISVKEINNVLSQWGFKKKSNFAYLTEEELNIVYETFQDVQKGEGKEMEKESKNGNKSSKSEVATAVKEEIKEDKKKIEEEKEEKEKAKEKDKDKKKIDEKPKKIEKREKKETKKAEGEVKKDEKKKKEEEIKIISIPEVVTVRELAEMLNASPNDIIASLIKKGILATINQSIDPQIAVEIAEDMGFLAEIQKEEEKEEFVIEEETKPENLQPRPPIVVIMGHVDHGKTTLLDTIRKSRIAEKEKGGITQHIGAYTVETKDGRKITFLDTPGHEAFTSLRARGAKVTDIGVLVVAADDGVMPQTVEAINHAKAFNVPIVVAVNKIDKPNADPMRVRRELTEHGLIPEDWGGDTIFVDVSAKTGQNVDQLLDMILLLADILELKADPTRKAKGTIIESKLDRYRGPVATVIVQEGTLRVGDIFVSGATYGRVRAMFNDKGEKLKEATPSTPVEILGFEELPDPGDSLIVVESEKKAKQIAEQRKEKKEQKVVTGFKLEELFKKIQEGDIKELNVVIKADTIGSLEAIKKSLDELSSEKVSIRVIHGAVGAISENDVMLAKATSAIVIGFNTRPDPKVRELLEKEKVDLRLYSIIYQVIDDIKKAMEGLLEPIEKEVILGSAEVRATFKIKGAGTVAGCYVLEGKIVRNAKARLIREGVVIYDGAIESVKRFKEDVQEVSRGYECGIKLKNFNDIKVGDIIECYEIKLEKPSL